MERFGVRLGWATVGQRRADHVTAAMKIFTGCHSNSASSISYVNSCTKQVSGRLQYTCWTCSLPVSLLRHLPDYVHLPVEIKSTQKQSGNSKNGRSQFPVLCCGTHCLMTLNQLSKLTPSNDFLKLNYLN